MMTIDERVASLGLVLPDEFRSPTGAPYPFSWVRVRGNRAYVSGHLPLMAELPFGVAIEVEAEVEIDGLARTSA